MDSISDLPVFSPSTQDENLDLLKSEKMSDVLFLVGKKQKHVRAHKFILIRASPVFEAQFGDRWDHENKIEIPEVSPNSFRMFLEFVYAEKFSVTENEAGNVLFLAHKYLMILLRQKCCDLLVSRIKFSNVISIHHTATQFNEKNLKIQAMDFILKNGSAVLEDIAFLQIDTDTLSKILMDDKLAVYEIKIFRAVMRWAENKCSSDGLELTVENKRLVLKDLIHLIRFSLMTCEEFKNEFIIGEHKGILSDMESNAVFEHLSVGPLLRSQLPKLPFDVNKRYNGFLNKVDIYEDPVSNSYEDAEYCRSNYNDASASCEIIFGFRSTQDICIRGIELSPSASIGKHMSYMCPVLADFGSTRDPEYSNMLFLAEISDIEKKQSFSGTFLPCTSANIGFESGFRIEKNINYNIKLIVKECGDLLKRPEALRRVGNLCLKGKTEFTFTTVSSKCCRQLEVDISPMICISCALVKTIHFTM